LNNKLTLAIILWFCLWVPLTILLVTLNPETPVIVEILFLLVAMVLASPVAIFLTKLLTSHTRTHIIKTGLSPVEGSFTSPSVGLPPKTTVQYRHAAKSPEVTVYQENGRYVGYEIDFGNGIIGCIRGRQIIRLTRGNLSVKVTGPGGTQSVNWK